MRQLNAKAFRFICWAVAVLAIYRALTVNSHAAGGSGLGLLLGVTLATYLYFTRRNHRKGHRK